MNSRLRTRFDQLLERILDELPPELKKLLSEMPVVVEDEPEEDVADEMLEGDDDELLGLYRGIPRTERSVEQSGMLPEVITLYRWGILDAAADDEGEVTDEALLRQIRITLLHEIGHHFGLDEEDLRRLGYG